MGLNILCAAWEAFAKFLNWTIKYQAASLADCENADCDHYLDDLIFAGPCDTGGCLALMQPFIDLCRELNLPIATDKQFGHVHA